MERGIGCKVDEHWGCPRIRTGGCERDGSAFIALLDGIILHGCATPGCCDAGIAVDTELDHKTADYAEKTRIVIKSVFHEIVEAIGTIRCPVPMHFDD